MQANNHCDCCHKKPAPPTCSHDHGCEPYTLNLRCSTVENNCFRKSIWTGKCLQCTQMCIPAGQDIGLEIHPKTDQFLYIECGQGCMMMGNCREHLEYQVEVCEDCGIFIPAGTWHNLINTGCQPIKLFSIYAPPEHQRCTLQRTKADVPTKEKC